MQRLLRELLRQVDFSKNKVNYSKIRNNLNEIKLKQETNKQTNKIGKNKQMESGNESGQQLMSPPTTTTTISQSSLNHQQGSTMPHPIQVNVTAKVGETVMLACIINSAGYNGLNPGVIWMQGNLGNVLTLNTNRITVDSRFEIVQQPLPSQSFQMSHRERPSSSSPPVAHHRHVGHDATATNERTSRLISLDEAVSSQSSRYHDDAASVLTEAAAAAAAAAVASPQSSSVNDINNYYHLKITNVQLYDENEYVCETSITKLDEDKPSLHSLVYLHVTRTIPLFFFFYNRVIIEFFMIEIKIFLFFVCRIAQFYRVAHVREQFGGGRVLGCRAQMLCGWQTLAQNTLVPNRRVQRCHSR